MATVDLEDSLSMQDAISMLYTGYGVVLDPEVELLNLWEDAQEHTLYDLIKKSDSMVIQDGLALILDTILDLADDADNLADAVVPVGDSTVDLTDTLAHTDAAATSLEVVLTQALADDMNNLSDAIVATLYGADVLAIRRQINDLR